MGVRVAGRQTARHTSWEQCHGAGAEAVALAEGGGGGTHEVARRVIPRVVVGGHHCGHDGVK